MAIADGLKSFFSWPPEEPANTGPFPDIAVPLVNTDGFGITSMSNATIIDANNGLLVTGKHCIHPGEQIMILAYDWHGARLVRSHPIDDIALIWTSAKLFTSTPKIPWAARTSEGEGVRVSGWLNKVGASLDKWDQICVRGKISGCLLNNGWPVKTGLAENDSIDGMSGSPAIDDKNELIGILTSRNLSYFRKRNKPTINITPIWFLKEIL